MRNIYLFVLISLFAYISNAQSAHLDWARSFGGVFYDYAESTAVDAMGNVYTTGRFSGAVDFNPGIGTSFLMSASIQSDVYIQKLDKHGNLEWAKSIGGAGDDRGNSIASDINGNVYVTGHFWQTVDFDPGAGVYNVTAVSKSDVFILKLDSSGNFIWAKTIGGISWEAGRLITTDYLGNIYISGSYSATLDFDPGPGAYNLTSIGTSDIFIVKLDPSGNFIWAKSYGGSGSDNCYDFTTDNFGNLFSVGEFKSIADFDPGTGSYNQTSNGFRDIFIQKLDSSGNFVWAKTMGGSGRDAGVGISVDAWRNVYITGDFNSVVDFNPGAAGGVRTSTGLYDMFILKLNEGGIFSWVRTVGDVWWDRGHSITNDITGNIFVTGFFRGTVDFNPSSSIINLSTNGNKDVFITELDCYGNFVWAQNIGSGWWDYPGTIAINYEGKIITSGYFKGTVDFQNGLPNYYLTTNGEYDAFVLQLTRCPYDTIIDVIASCDSIVWIDGISYTNSNYSATYDYIDTTGCDSTILLNLTITSPDTVADFINTCDSIIWIDGNTYSASNNTATYTLSNANGCDSVVILDLNINTVDVSLTTALPGITSNASGASYQWLDCNNNFAVITGETAQTFTAIANGSFAVEVSQNGCTDTSVCITITSLELERQKSFGDVSIVPNPTDGPIIVKLGKLRDVSIKIFSCTGQLVYQEYSINSPLHRLELDVERGIYMLEIRSHGYMKYMKFLKE
jgi:hypothetical protein